MCDQAATIDSSQTMTATKYGKAVTSRVAILVVFFIFSTFHRAAAFSTTKFVEWFPGNPSEFAQFRQSWTGGPCTAIYDIYVHKGEGICGDVLNCLLENTSELQKTTIASAQIVLGLIPSLLAGFGNGVPELSIMASQRPLLSFLLTLGAPAMYPNRISKYTNPIELLVGAPHDHIYGHTIPLPRTVKITLQYLLAAAASFNNIELALRIGSRSVLAWGCRSWYGPLLWVLFPISTYLFAAMSCQIAKKGGQHVRHSNGISWWCVENYLSRCMQSLQSFLRVPSLEKGRDPSATNVILQIMASCLAWAHVVLGTLILPSLIFVGFHDTMMILFRFLGSAAVCRMLFLFQLDNVRGVV